MKKTLSVLAFAVAGMSLTAHAQPFQFRGSDTLYGAITDAINGAGLADQLQYLGGGSGLGESGIVAGTQNIAPMSRALKDSAIDNLLNQGVTPVQNVIGLDGVAVYVKDGEGVTQIDIPTLKGIFQSCTINDWSLVPGSTKSGPITVFRRDDNSGTTDTFRTLVGITSFGACVSILPTTEAIADTTSNDPTAIAYAGLSGERPGANKALAVAANPAGPFIAPAQDSIRTFAYPLARRLYLQVVSDARVPSDVEQALVDKVLDRSFMDPILIRNEFITCLPVEEGGCP
jgi:phosphate transport system substrate-binding protein